MNRAAAVALFALVACKAREDSVPTRTAGPAKSKPGVKAPGSAAPTDPLTADALIHAAQERAGDHALSRIQIEYVGADGTLDPRYSRGTIGFTRTRQEPDDDPDRPTGAPVAKSARQSRSKCPTWSWEPGSWSSIAGYCSAQVIESVRCPITVIWQRAIDDGAPRDALAKLTLIGKSWRATGALRWNLDIRDTVRGVSFMRSYADDCGPIAEAPDPTVAPDRPLPEGIDRKMISNSVGTVKPKIRACHTGRSRARVVIGVSVTPDGKATTAIKEATTPQLGQCVAAIIGDIPFPRTRGGGTFSYPFTF